MSFCFYYKNNYFEEKETGKKRKILNKKVDKDSLSAKEMSDKIIGHTKYFLPREHFITFVQFEKLM